MQYPEVHPVLVLVFSRAPVYSLLLPSILILISLLNVYYTCLSVEIFSLTPCFISFPPCSSPGGSQSAHTFPPVLA